MKISIAPLPEAKARMDGKVAVGTDRKNWQMQEVPLAMRERAFWSARLQSAHMAQGLLDMLRKRAGLETQTVDRQGKPEELTMSKSLFVREGRKLLGAAGYKPGDPAWDGTLLDHRSKQRLELIYDTNVRQAGEYARFQAGQMEGALDAFPAQELIREETRVNERPWRQIWRDHGGQLFGGRMIALKSDRIWYAVSRFGTPFPPFDFGSGMGVLDVARDEAEAFGLIAPGEPPERADVGFNDELQASVKGLDPKVVGSLLRSFGDQAVLSGGELKWQADLVPDFVRQAAADKAFKGEVSLGVATKRTVEAAKDLADLEGYDLKLTADETRHAMKMHGEGNETSKDQAGLTPQDFARLPDLWRSPDEVLPGNKPNTLKFKKDIDGILTMVTWRMNPKQRTIYLQTLWKKKKSGAGSLVNKSLGQNVRNGSRSKGNLHHAGGGSKL